MLNNLENTLKHLLVILLLVSAVAQAQTDRSDATLRAGVELDALPFVTGGYYASAWAGRDGFRLRGVFTQFNAPEFMIPEGFEEQKTNAYTILLDYFPSVGHNEFEKWWIGGGLEYWDSRVMNSAEQSVGAYEQLMLTVGTGYVWRLWGNLYINPWAAMHLALFGSDELRIGGAAFKPDDFLYEASIKLGWYF